MTTTLLTEEQQALVETTLDFAQDHLAPHALDWDRDKHFPVDVLRKAAGLGLGGVYVGEESGGSGLSRADGVLVFETLATGCPSIAGYLSIHNMVAWMIDHYGDPAQRDRRLPRLCSMDDLASYCLTEPGAGSDAAALATRAVRDGEGWVLSGVKQFISGAGASQLYVVMARTGGEGAAGVSAFLVEKDDPGVGFGPDERKMGWNAQPTRQVVLDGVRLPADRLLGREGEGFRIAMNGLNGGRLGIAACSLGGARSALDRSLTHLADREAFGRRLLDADALRFRLADMATELAAARALVQQAAQALDRGDPQAPYLCAMAKRFATDTGYTVADRALQLHGGYGYLSEYGIEKIVRDLRVHRILEGTNEIMRVIVARGLTEAFG
ncbi:acyl-CoA dehydrogenase family protein [Streptomyces clavuligerus]|uniref:Acyl-CoA dehydrogenase domain-containing protein n=1 Tax=Streptomyces clavuligerus TaxID=1901 RepID=B5GMB5_STRCL|nr:acyl-CoA dehydrogenase family protein [Streptomyces clavuligerus]ANW22342.1 acyl-CoA dehydrogenase [Streptomyces clavuligerus]AXU17242.1 acyl-CoA dehydrogenase [Streptomyces clavuligerus]EDY47461.1 acyl-CoA dehydrogenase domain-containing protein [Streptomyces clavuligerus]EFG04425.1 Acyl-CoA dehydrogenase domain-containing protein [Streptomyces clavuligerus]MBY6307113.1 acyl-CoA dehydrogenase family protein [Streptomyces clavuligerus]